MTTKWNTLLAGMILGTSFVGTASAAILTVGGGGDYTDFASALSDAGENDTIRFIDSATYNVAGGTVITGKSGLTIESAVGQLATINFSNASTYGFNLNSTGITLQKLTLIREGTLVTGGANATIMGVNFISTKSDSSTTNLLETGNGMNISYSTFLGTGANANGGRGISWTAGTTVTVDHSSFDQLRFGIFNPSSSGTTSLSVTNSAFGEYQTGGANNRGIIIDGTGTDMAFEDYNAVYGPSPLTRAADVTAGKYISGSGDNSIKYGSYFDVFVGDTSAGDWRVAPDLYFAASDGMTIGAWQFVPEPSSALLLALGGLAVASRCRRRGTRVARC